MHKIFLSSKVKVVKDLGQGIISTAYFIQIVEAIVDLIAGYFINVGNYLKESNSERRLISRNYLLQGLTSIQKIY